MLENYYTAMKLMLVLPCKTSLCTRSKTCASWNTCGGMGGTCAWFGLWLELCANARMAPCEINAIDVFVRGQKTRFANTSLARATRTSVERVQQCGQRSPNTELHHYRRGRS